MALETGTYISDLVTSNPPQSDSLTQAAGHLRLLKSVIQATFPNINGAISATDEEIDGAAAAYAAGSFVPTGVMVDYGGSAAPTGWLLCYGQSVLRADYADLFAVIGTTFGAADGTHFNIPDRRDRFSVGKGNMGGSDAAIIDSLLTTTTLGSTYDGEGAIDTITLAEANIPSHTHSVSISGTTGAGGAHTHSFSGTTASNGAHTHTVSDAHRDSTTTRSSSGSTSVNTGEQTDTRTTSSDGSHTHTFSGTTGAESSHTHSFTASGTSGATGSTTAFTVAILPPSLVVNVIIKT